MGHKKYNLWNLWGSIAYKIELKVIIHKKIYNVQSYSYRREILLHLTANLLTGKEGNYTQFS